MIKFDTLWLNARNRFNCFGIAVDIAGLLIAVALFLGGASPVQSAQFFVSAGASGAGDGSQNAPFSSPAQALESGRVRGGDQIVLQAGAYGRFKIRGQKFRKTVVIVAEKGSQAHFDQIEIVASENITLKGLSVWPTAAGERPTFLVRSFADTTNIRFENMDVRGARDAGSYRQWSKSKWLANKVNGIWAEGRGNVISRSNLTGLYHAMSVSGQGGQLLNNRVLGYSGDGARALGDNSLVRGNSFQDCVKVDANHDDAFMAWSLGPGKTVGAGTIKGLVIENNLIEEWTGPKNHPLICSLQGIFLGGYLDDLVIQNNVVSVSAYHGITAYGVTRGLIANNTLINSRGPSRTQPWIGIWGHRDRGSRQVTVVNNVAPLFKVNAKPGASPQEYRNVVLTYPAQQLRAPLRGDYRPKPGSDLINRGNSRLAPVEDIAGTPRPLGGAVDIGAYEVQ